MLKIIVTIVAIIIIGVILMILCGLKFLGRHHYDVCFCFIIIASVTIDILFICNVLSVDGINNFYQWFDDNSIYQFVSLITPIFDSIVSSIIATSTTRICNISLHDFRKFRGKYEYNALSIELFSIVLLVCSILASIFNMACLVISTTFIALFYAIYFIFKEIPILALNEKRIKKIIGKRYSIDKRNIIQIDNDYDGQNDINMIKVISYLIIKDGINDVYNLIMLQQKDTLDSYSVAMDLTQKLNENLRCYITGLPNPMEASGYDAQDVIYHSYMCLRSLVSRPDDTIYKALMVENNDNFALRVRDIVMNIEFDLQWFGFNQLYKNNAQYFFESLLPNKDQTKDSEIEINTKTKILNYLLTESLCNEDLFIYDSFNETFKTNVISLGSLKNFHYYIFSSIYLFYSMNDPGFTDEFRDVERDYFVSNEKEKLNAFLSPHSSWFFTPNFCVDLLISLLRYLSTVNSEFNWLLIGKNTKFSNVVDLFWLDYIFDWWFAFALSDFAIIPADAYAQIEEKLSDSELSEFKFVYNNFWKSKTQTEIDEKPIVQYFKLLGHEVSEINLRRRDYFFSKI